MAKKTQINLYAFLMETITNPEEYEKVSLELSRITNGIKTYEDLVRVANLDFENIKISDRILQPFFKVALSHRQLIIIKQHRQIAGDILHNFYPFSLLSARFSYDAEAFLFCRIAKTVTKATLVKITIRVTMVATV